MELENGPAKAQPAPARIKVQERGAVQIGLELNGRRPADVQCRRRQTESLSEPLGEHVEIGPVPRRGGGLGLELQSSSPHSRAGAPPAVRNEEIIRLMQM
ncbi:unnamed protein product [Arctogadus glacialis]